MPKPARDHSTCAVTLVERPHILDGQSESMPAEGHRELVKEPDLAKYHLPGRHRPRVQEANLRLPLHTGLAWFGGKSERHVCGTGKSRLTADLHWDGVIRIGIDPDLPCQTRGGEDSLGTGVHQREEGCVIVRLRPDERDADHRSETMRPVGCVGPLDTSSS
jgi:hypothetical protein